MEHVEYNRELSVWKGLSQGEEGLVRDTHWLAEQERGETMALQWCQSPHSMTPTAFNSQDVGQTDSNVTLSFPSKRGAGSQWSQDCFCLTNRRMEEWMQKGGSRLQADIVR